MEEQHFPGIGLGAAPYSIGPALHSKKPYLSQRLEERTGSPRAIPSLAMTMMKVLARNEGGIFTAVTRVKGSVFGFVITGRLTADVAIQAII